MKSRDLPLQMNSKTKIPRPHSTKQSSLASKSVADLRWRQQLHETQILGNQSTAQDSRELKRALSPNSTTKYRSTYVQRPDIEDTLTLSPIHGLSKETLTDQSRLKLEITAFNSYKHHHQTPKFTEYESAMRQQQEEIKMRSILRSLGQEVMPGTTLYEMISILETQVKDVSKQKENNRLNREQMQKDVTKLLQNQALFDDRVKEMDSVFGLLQKEKKELRKKRKGMKQKAMKVKTEMMGIMQDLHLRREEVDHFRKEMRSMMDVEVKKLMQKRSQCLEMPFQGNHTQKFESVRPQLDQNHYKREQQLCDWEIKVHNMDLQATQKLKEIEAVNKVSEQKRKEIQENTKKLEKMTRRWDDIVQKESWIREQADIMEETLKEMETREIQIKEEEKHIQDLRQQLYEEQLQAGLYDSKLARAQNQCNMQIEDFRVQCIRNQENLDIKEKDLIWREIQLKADKGSWQTGVQEQSQKLDLLMNEKQEHVQVLEATIRQQFEELTKAQQKQAKKEEKFRKYEEKTKLQLKKEKEDIESKVEIYGEILEECERKERKRDSISRCGSMPRQMPLGSCSQKPKSTFGDEHHFQRSSPIRQTQADLSFDQDRQLEMLLGVKDLDRDKSLLDDSDGSDQENRIVNLKVSKPPKSNSKTKNGKTQVKRKRKDFVGKSTNELYFDRLDFEI